MHSVFNLSKQSLLPIVENAAKQKHIRSFRIKMETKIKGMQGYSAEKSVPTFYYISKEGKEGRITVFVKRMTCGKSEAKHFEAFSDLKLPIPLYYGHLMGSQGEEILFMEYLNNIGIDHTNDFEISRFIRLIAQINSANISRNYSFVNSSSEPLHTLVEKWKETLVDVYDNGCSGKIGPYIRNFCKLYPLKTTFSDNWLRIVGEIMFSMPKGLNHNDMSPQNIGWKNNRKEIVLFDLHNVGIAPRFVDISKILSWLYGINANIKNRKYALLYLNEYQNFGGPKIDLQKFLKEVAWMTTANDLSTLTFQLLQSLSGKVDYTKDTEEGKKSNQVWLLHSLHKLLKVAQK